MSEVNHNLPRKCKSTMDFLIRKRARQYFLISTRIVTNFPKFHSWKMTSWFVLHLYYKREWEIFVWIYCSCSFVLYIKLSVLLDPSKKVGCSHVNIKNCHYLIFPKKFHVGKYSGGQWSLDLQHYKQHILELF